MSWFNMKMNFLRNKKTILLIVFLLIIFVFKDSVTSSVFYVSRPFLRAWNSIMDSFGGKSPETSLIPELEAKILICEAIEKQNEELKTLLSRAGEEKYAVASVLSRPPQSPYDVLIIDAGSEQGIENGMQVTAYGDILLGYVSEVFAKTSKVKLISFSREETNVYIADSNISAIAVGMGGENLEITLPRSIEIKSGDRITTLGMNPLAIGIAERVEIDPADPFQKILFRLPVNIQEMKYVMIKI